MKTTLKLHEFILIHCILYHFIQQYHLTDARCSWGSWLPWNCSCCGGSVENDVYRIRAKCCDNTSECVNVRIAAAIITDKSEFENKGSCSNDCPTLFSQHNSNHCTSSKITLDDVTEQNRIKSCNYACIGTLTTTTIPAKPTTTKVTGKTTLHNASSQTTKIFRGGENGTITTKNDQSQTFSLQTRSSVKDTTIFPGVVTGHVSKRMTSANASFAFPSSSKFQTGNNVSSEKNTPSNVTNRKTTPTRVPPSRASGKTLTTIYSTAEGSSTVSYESSSNAENVVDPDDINYCVVIVVPVVIFVLLLLVGIVIYKRFVK
ncbi:uncharacterized protein LOC132727025 isoform X2 [Ruditapes philippinarum]|uniref:uncharacterized protein LOC132727025 isoform X2 n=1 Tax=Ruditapes philippinarum TaxID=129788 RepID=UPI00295BC8E5|nr:uncharacterized protein LOC132727025 isoform X2 [Ruditapes philippinarum]